MWGENQNWLTTFSVSVMHSIPAKSLKPFWVEQKILWQKSKILNFKKFYPAVEAVLQGYEQVDQHNLCLMFSFLLHKIYSKGVPFHARKAFRGSRWSGVVSLGLGYFTHSEKASTTHAVEDLVTATASLDILETKNLVPLAEIAKNCLIKQCNNVS